MYVVELEAESIARLIRRQSKVETDHGPQPSRIGERGAGGYPHRTSELVMLVQQDAFEI
jgi:hypothetical protein